MTRAIGRLFIAAVLSLPGLRPTVAFGAPKPGGREEEPLQEMHSPDVAPLPYEFVLEDPTARPQPDPEPPVVAETDVASETGTAAIAEAPPPVRPPIAVFGGYVDFGFFVPSGNGAGWIQDTGPLRVFPDEANRFNWVLLGDIMAPAINTRGEPADLGDAPGVIRTDNVDSNGAFGFIANEVNLNASSAVLSNVLATTSVNFTPRTGSNFSWGDSFDVDIAQFEWLVGSSQRTSIFVGKSDSAIGIEYRERKASQRFGITPSLLARYTTGTPLGIKIRTKLGSDERLVLTGAVTNGSTVIEPFHFYDEVDSNNGKTASGRVSFRLPLLPFDLEIGVSGLYGSQDRALDSRGRIWFAGVDLLGQIGPLALKGQYLQGAADGETDRRYADKNRPYGLDLQGGAYLEANLMLGPVLGLLARGEYRDARVWIGNPAPDNPDGIAERLYITKSWRATFGFRVVFSDRLVAKAEYLHNGEYGGIPNIQNDVFTTSCVWLF
jgi:hypothetical protein